MSRILHTSCKLDRSGQVESLLLQQLLSQGLGGALFDNLVADHLLLQCPKVAGFRKFSEARQVCINGLVRPLSSRPEFVAFCYNVSLWREVAVKGGFHFLEGLVFAWKRIDNALYPGAKAMQQCSSLDLVRFRGET